MAIYGGLIEAYKGFYEDEMRADFDEHFIEHGLGAAKREQVFNLEWAEKKIRSHTPKERLAIYLEWNGILGWTDIIWDISQGSFEN